MIGLLLLCIVLIWLWVFWGTHVSMNKDQDLPYDYVNFKTFMQEFKKYEDDPRLEIRFGGQSIFLRKTYLGDYILYLHADIVKINNRCMIFYPWSYCKYKIWMKKFTASYRRIKGLWNGGEN